MLKTAALLWDRVAQASRLCAVAFVALPALAQDARIDHAAKVEVLDALREALTRHAYADGVDFGKWGEHLRTHHDALDDADTTFAFTQAVQRALGEFGVSHVAIVPPEVGRQMERSVTIGIGAETRPASGGLRVLAVMADSAAKDAGLAPGDVITHVDGKRAARPEDLEGAMGSEAVLRVRRLSGGAGEIRVARVITDSREPATLREVSADTMIFHLPTFNTGYDHHEVEDLIARAFWKDNLIIDLRGNGGGRVTNLLHLLSLLVPEGEELGTVVTNDIAARYVEETGGNPADARAVAKWSKDKLRTFPNTFGPYPGKLAVLIDGGSASASEVTTMALRERRGAVVVGARSAGALLVSRYMPLAHGFLVQIPFSDYITTNGERPEGVGIKPDVEAAGAARGKGEDAGVAAALRAVEGE